MAYLSEKGQGLLELLIIIMILSALLILFFDFETTSTEVIENGFHTKSP